MITRPSQWNSLFNNPFLENCNINFYDDDDVFILDKTYIQKFSWKGESSFVCNRLPIDEATLIIRGWNKLPSTTQEYLKTKGNYVSIGYVIGGYESGWKIMYITDFNYDTTNLLMTIKFKGKLQTMSDEASVSMSAPIPYATDICRQLDTYFNYEGTKDYLATFMPNQITKAQAFQQLALTMCGGLRNKAESTNVEIISYPNATLPFHKRNIYNRIKFYSSEISSDVEVLGSYVITGAGVGRTYLGEVQTKTSGLANFTFQGNFVNFTSTQTSPASPQYSSIIYIYNNKLMFGSTSRATTRDVNADMLRLETSQQQNYTTISSYCLYNLDTQKVEVQKYASNYFSNNIVAEFECRIDPCLEPLDCIRTNNKYYLIESVSFDFNGGFRGKIKAREQVRTMPALIKNLEMSNGGQTFSFDVYNPNGFMARLAIKHLDGQSATITGEGGMLYIPIISPYGTLHIDQTNADSLSLDFIAYYQSSLQYEVYAILSDFVLGGGLPDSINETILKPNS